MWRGRILKHSLAFPWTNNKANRNTELPYWIGLMRCLLPVNIEANFDNEVLIIVLTTYENVLNNVLPCPTETLLDILKLGFFAAGTVHSSLWKTRKKMGLHLFFFFWLDFLYLNRTTSNSNCQSTRVRDISEKTAKRTVIIFFNTKYKHCGVYTWPEKIVLVYQIHFRKKQHARENKYLPFNGWVGFWNFPLLPKFGRQWD